MHALHRADLFGPFHFQHMQFLRASNPPMRSLSVGVDDVIGPKWLKKALSARHGHISMGLLVQSVPSDSPTRTKLPGGTPKKPLGRKVFRQTFEAPGDSYQSYSRKSNNKQECVAFYFKIAT
jgi:hypothetical protein